MLIQRKNSIIIVQLLVVVMFLFGSAEAKGIEAVLWEIGWDADAKQVKQCLEGQGFERIEQGKDMNGRQWQKFRNGLFSGFQCDIQVVWQSKQLAEINIESTGAFLLGTEFTYRNLVEQFTSEYGRPTEQDKYMLKIFPGIWVETVKWTVIANGAPSFEVIVVQNSPADKLGFEAADPSKISISFKKTVGNLH